jgi:fructose-bisphosphate aldolase class 1
MSSNDLSKTAQALVADGTGILAADETVPTVTRRLAALAVESTPQTRRAYREMFFTTPGVSNFISGIIMQDETIRQNDSNGTPLTDLLNHLNATVHLNEINQLEGPKPWKLSFSYGRALQDEALKAWRGDNENIRDGQRAFYHRAKCDSAAALGRYSPAMERESLVREIRRELSIR